MQKAAECAEASFFFSQGGVAWCTADEGKPTGRGLVAVLNVLGEGINLGAIHVFFHNIEDFWKFCEAVVDGQGYLVYCQCQTDNTEWLKITCALFAMIHGIKGKWKFKQFVFLFFFLSFLFFFYEALKNLLPPRANVGVPAAQEHR